MLPNFSGLSTPNAFRNSYGCRFYFKRTGADVVLPCAFVNFTVTVSSWLISPATPNDWTNENELPNDTDDGFRNQFAKSPSTLRDSVCDSVRFPTFFSNVNSTVVMRLDVAYPVT